MVIVGVWLVEGGWWKRGSFLLALWELIVHSCLSHKEHRYVLPIVPIASLYAGTQREGIGVFLRFTLIAIKSAV